MRYTFDMNQTYALIRSRTFWTIFIMSLLPVANAIVPTFPPAVASVCEVLLGVVAAYFHNQTAINSGAVN
jgi:hypothetical protein